MKDVTGRFEIREFLSVTYKSLDELRKFSSIFVDSVEPRT